jgi:hypothetical protein
MPTIVKVDYDNEPRGASRFRSINCNKVYYGYEPSKFQFVKGQSYEIEFESKVVNGKAYHTITSAKPASESSGHVGGGDLTARDIFIAAQAIAKVCLERDLTTGVADTWLDWAIARATRTAPDEQVPF